MAKDTMRVDTYKQWEVHIQWENRYRYTVCTKSNQIIINQIIKSDNNRYNIILSQFINYSDECPLHRFH